MLLASTLSASDELSAMSLIRMRDFPKLGALIFGEGVMNDALSIVLFQSLLSSYNDDTLGPILIGNVFLQIVASCFIGCSCGFLSSRIQKLHTNLKSHPVRESAIVLVFGYLAYGIAESCEISGILTIFIAGVTQVLFLS
jgi:NhaP-type Na+/H+ or K+/H+ antiporter